MTRDEAWAALRAAYPGKTHDIKIGVDDWDMTHTEPFVWFSISVMNGPDGERKIWQHQAGTLAECVAEAVKRVQPAPIVHGEAAAFMQAAEPVPELSREQTGRLTAALAETPTPPDMTDTFADLSRQMASEEMHGPKDPPDPLTAPPTADEYKIDTEAAERRRLSVLEPLDGSVRK